jgi:hypothetical protein
MHYLKTTLAAIGAASVLVLAANTVAIAANGHGFLLGQSNSASKITTLTRTTSGPALQVKTKSSSNAPFTVNGKGKVTNLNADRLDGIDSSGFVRAGGHGAALGYAHILPGGSFDASRSWNVSAGNVASTVAGFFCFHGLSFTPHSGALTVDYNGTLNGQVIADLLRLPTTGADCGLSSAQAEVFTGHVTPGTTTVGANIGYFITFY